jgi:hypothetical protein
MAFTAAWNAAFEALPADGDNVSDGATKIRNLKNSIRERLAIDHYMDIAGTDADHGEHSKITFHAQSAKPSNVANKGFLYTKDVDSVVELHWEDESGNELDITRLGRFNSARGFHDGTYTITFPTNGTAASTRIMTGNTNTIAWFYLNTAPPGWKALTTGADMVLAVSGGAAAYNVNGGNPDSAATWTIAAAHVHQWYNHTDGNVAQTYDSNGDAMTIPTGTTSYLGIYAQDTAAFATKINADSYTTPAGASAGTWRPKASVGKLFQLDTA